MRYPDDSIVFGSDIRPLKMTLAAPRWGQYNIVLADGTKVWSNAETKSFDRGFFKNLMTIPRTEIDVNSNIEQNFGY